MVNPSENGKKQPTTSTTSTRRQRAPTITIDTSAVSPPLAEDGAHPLVPISSNRPQAPYEDHDEVPSEIRDPGSGPLSHDSSPIELRPAHSFDSSRPTSPHNVSSPTSKWSDRQPQNFLSVPTARSRGNSVDSDDMTHSPTSYGGDTFIPSPASSQLGDGRLSDTAHSNDHLLGNDEALKADPGTESDFNVADNRFAFSPGQLSKMFNPKSLSAFHALGGLRGLEKGLRTDRLSGLSVDEKKLDGVVSFEDATVSSPEELEFKDHGDRAISRTATNATTAQLSNDSFYDRKRIFSDNHLPEKKAKSIFELAWLAYNDKVLILLTVAAVISLALGIYQSVTAKDGEARVQWVEGVAIVIAIVIVVVVGAANDWQKERQFVKLNKKKEDRLVKVIRSGRSREISVHDIFVGDVVHIEPGDMIPVDGIFISGYNVHCDESSATGESDLLKKSAGAEVYRTIETRGNLRKLDPFIMSGSKVTEGIGTFLVTAVGINSCHGKTMMSLREDAQTTPLQSKLNVLAEYIAKLGLGAGLLLFVVTFIEFCVRLSSIQGGASEKGQQFLNVFIVAVTIVVVAVPEGLPLAVTLALAFATTRMLKDHNLVRLLRACETMGNATTICSDKTGTLTQNKMSIVAGTFGTTSAFADIKTNDGTSPTSTEGSEQRPPSAGGTLTSANFVSTLNNDVKELLKESIVANTTAFEDDKDASDEFIGSKTETALLSFARNHLAMGPLGEERSSINIVQLVPFDSGRKCMATIVKTNTGKYRLYVKGASEMMLVKCQKIIRDPTKGLEEALLTTENTAALTAVIDSYASRSLRTIGLLYKDFDRWPPKGCPTEPDDPKMAVFDNVFRDMVFCGIVGLQDPLRDGVAEAVRECQKAGVFVRMVTGDNILTAKAIAEECGIYSTGGIVMEGPQFRKLSKSQMNQTIPRLQVLARSSPDDKRVLVKRLKELGETVAVTGDGTNDAPALKTADVGFSMGIAGTEVAKEASAIILMDDNFASIVKAIMWGRAVNDSVKKFLQFQVTVNITAVALTFISAVGSSSETSVLTAVQLLWVNLIMDTFAALALATDAPTPSILNRKPEPRSAPLITLTMWKMIVGQSIYQLVVTVVLYFAGSSILTHLGSGELQTLIFNTFVWMQIFNQYNCRRIDNKFNIFEGILRNWFFIGIQVVIVGGQLLIIFVGGAAFAINPLGSRSWAISIILGVLSVPIAVLIRLIPDDLVRRLIPNFLRRKKTPEVFVSDEERHYQWNPALEDIKEELAFLKMLRGGRIAVLKYKLSHPSEIFTPRSRSGSRSRTSSLPQTPTGEQSTEFGGGSPAPPTPDSRRSMTRRRGRSRSNSAFGPAAAMAGIIAGSIGGWSPIERRDGEGNISNFAPLQHRSDLEVRDGLEVHADTDRNDPVIAGPSHNTYLMPPSQLPELSPNFGQQLTPPSHHNSDQPRPSGGRLAVPERASSHGSPSRSHQPHGSA
ncbi:hypothetical protein MMC11_005091 [Xylographa trunciseda]|nr:hypothetical protein [Xylographa trunciseda]